MVRSHGRRAEGAAPRLARTRSVHYRVGPISATELVDRFAATPNTRIHGFLRDQHAVAGIGRRLANEVCHRAKISPFAMTRKLGADGAEAVATAIAECVAEGLADERARPT